MLKKLFAFFTVFIALSGIAVAEDKSVSDKAAAAEIQAEAPAKGITLYAYIENSGSMDGYVNGMSTFKSDLYSMFSNSSISALKMYYINSKVIGPKKDAKKFILNLTPASFKAEGGMRNSSDIADIVDRVLKMVSEDKIVLLASDFIFSPQAEYRKNVPGYLKLQQEDIKNSVGRMIKNDSDNKYAIVFLQGQSYFDGWFYDIYDKPSKKQVDRPYYILMAGNKKMIAELLHKTKKVTHFVNSYSEFAPMEVKYEIVDNHAKQIGDLKLKENRDGRDPHRIVRYVPAKDFDTRKKVFQFVIAADLSCVPLHDSYLMDVNNYKLSDPSYKIREINLIDEKPGFTHEFVIYAEERIPPAKLEIMLVNRKPNWINEHNDDNGTEFKQDKTFGLADLTEGITSAYKEYSRSGKHHFKIEISIER